MRDVYNERVTTLYELAKSRHHLEEVYNDFQVFKDGVGGEMPFTQMMTRENITNSSKAALLQDICQYFQEETRQFIQYFIDEAQYGYIYRAIKYFEQIYAKYHVDITTAIPLTQEQIDSIVSAISKKMKMSVDTCTTIVDEDVIGGVKVKSADFVLDATLLAKLKAFKETF
ncbi:ATP synthase F1 subunit delta [Granulicatella sp. zg-ZJ]|uniref:ATP synthase F1 subunit delta n=1 Tax=unclassified Granulicatella TaxID=2630493 RepID=UPI0013C161CB|nr:MULTISPECIES: ATP synthase F1 subunit delta [unclassified Granulicatella]MBS4749981.1 ATP synthase F1 subunit delta [Carnobacteriaceae bacterium zg-ZUI78]NEW63095.1 ATP synthase F1 subunit delta [Granulicatella sp. zg-ZJ]NEW66179.1 ATP synthase F1 subunit delta [Granulicatella sp. zg-84]QMI86064.1 ATP synthase F1 subunit delta [Carnobacteriaceae bacterium zg-84]